MADENQLARYLRSGGQANALLAPYSYAPSEYTTADEMRQERISQMFGWDTSRPGREFLMRALTQLPQLPLAIPHTTTAWAGRTPSAITGGRPRGNVPYDYMEEYHPHLAPLANSSSGIQQRFPLTLQAGSRMGYRAQDPMPSAHYNRLVRMLDDGYGNRNSPSANLRTSQERAWWLNRIPGGE